MNTPGPSPSHPQGRLIRRDPSDTEDLRQVQEFLAGNPRAFEALFDKYREKVYSTAYRFLQDKEEALEVVQDVFLRVYQGLPGFRTGSKFFTWLYRITVNRAIDRVRSRRARPRVELDAGPEGEGLAERLAHPTSPDPEDLLRRKELSQKLLQAVDSLSEKHRAVFVLHALEGLSYKEIAEVVGCSLGTVMSRLFYARKKLQEQLAQYGISYSPPRT